MEQTQYFRCPKCRWESERHIAMKPVCPECHGPLNSVKANFVEIRDGTSPTNSDTDGDGVSDADEPALGRDPTFNEALFLVPVLKLLLDRDAP